jgi:hypothetical protein
MSGRASCCFQVNIRVMERPFRGKLQECSWAYPEVKRMASCRFRRLKPNPHPIRIMPTYHSTDTTAVNICIQVPAILKVGLHKASEAFAWRVYTVAGKYPSLTSFISSPQTPAPHRMPRPTVTFSYTYSCSCMLSWRPGT